MLLRSACAAIAFFSCASAHAQWIYEGHDSAFEGTGVHLALVPAAKYGFGLRCEQGEIVAILLTPEPIDNDAADNMNMLPIELLIRVDENAPLNLLAFIESASGKLRASADAEVSLAEELVAAKRRVVAAIRAGGNLYHEQRFGVSGSTRVVTQMMDRCGAEAPAADEVPAADVPVTDEAPAVE